MKRKKVINSAAETYMNGLFEDGVEIPNEDYENIFDAFCQGAQWADNYPKSPWISVKADLPCNHEELISTDDKRDTLYVVAVIRGHIIFSRMRKLEGKWFWENDEPTHWFPIPKSPK